MSEIEDRIAQKIKSTKDAAEAERVHKQLEMTQANLTYENDKAKYEKAFREVIKPTVGSIVSWLERKEQQVKVDAATPFTMQLTFAIPGKPEHQSPLLTIGTSSDMKAVQLYGFHGVAIGVKPKFEPAPLPIENLDAAKLHAEIMKFLEQAL